MLDADSSVFVQNSKMRFKLTLTANQQDLHMYIRAIIHYADGTPVTMITSKEAFEAKCGEDRKVTFSLDTQYIVPGKYTLSLILYEVNQFGTFRNCDGVKDAYCFEIKAGEDFAHKMEWSHRYWGHVALGEIKSKPNKDSYSCASAVSGNCTGNLYRLRPAGGKDPGRTIKQGKNHSQIYAFQHRRCHPDFQDIAFHEYESIFENEVLGKLRDFHEEYGLKATLYVLGNWIPMIWRIFRMPTRRNLRTTQTG